MALDIMVAVAAAQEIAKAVNNFIDLLPDHQERQLERFHKFRQARIDELYRPDPDHDDLIYWTQLERVFLTTLLKEISTKSKK